MIADRQLSILIRVARARDFSLTLAADGTDDIRLALDRCASTPEIHVELHDSSLSVLLKTALDMMCTFPQQVPYETKETE